MPNDTDKSDDESREKYGIAGGKSTVEKLQESTDDDQEGEGDDE